MLLSRRHGLLGAAATLVAGETAAQHRIVSAESTVMLEHEDRIARLREAVDYLKIDPAPGFTVTTVPRSRMPAYFNVDAPVLRVAFSERTFFDTARSTVLPTGLMAVSAVAAATRGESPDVALFVAGHTDDRGGEAYNQNLSVNRANAVSDALMGFGVGEVALWRVGFGESAPFYANDSDEHRAFNRRVEFLFGARVEPVVEVLSDQLENACISSSEAESRRCIALRRPPTFEASQASTRPIGVPLDRAVSTTVRAPAGTLGAGSRRAGAATLNIPRRLTISLRRPQTIAALDVLSHEIMNSLTPVTSLAQSARLLLTDGDREGAGDALAVLERRSVGLLRFVESYRALARLPLPVLRPVTVAPLMADVQRLFERHDAGDGVTLELSRMPDATVLADPDLLVQAVINLLLNAAQAAASSPGAAEAPRVRFSVGVDKDGVRFEVSDNGPGLGGLDPETILKPFFTSRPSGAGIGLSLVSQIIAGHNSRLDFGPSDIGATGLQVSFSLGRAIPGLGSLA